MAPSGRRRRRAATKSSTTKTRRPKRTQYKEHQKQKKQQHGQQVKQPNNENVQKAEIMEDLLPSTCPTANSDFDGIDPISTSSNSGCSTPKAERFRIPEIVTCPPAPKKQRVIPNCSLQRNPIAFFAPPDLELFFFFALRDISV